MMGSTLRKPYLHRRRIGGSHRAEVLQAGIVPAEQQRGHQGQHDDDHDPLEVDAVPDMAPVAGDVVRDEKKRFESVERRMELLEFTSFFEIRLDPVYVIP